MTARGVVCVLGMHRSGTSVVTRVLNLLGVYLGSTPHLFGPRADNPTGFWEHAHLVAVNEEILARCGGSWHEPPALAVGWERSSGLSDLRERVAALIEEEFVGAEPWGWKDPRTCLTLPFWRSVLPPMVYVLCLRDPLSVARSLQARDGFGLEKGGRLWLTYVEAALAHTAGEPRLILFYEDLLADPDVEVRRLATFLGRDEEASRVEVRAGISEYLRQEMQHHGASLSEVARESGLPFSAKALYAALRLAFGAGPGGSGHKEALNGALAALGRAAQEAVADQDRSNAEVDRLRGELEQLEAQLAGLRSHPLWQGYLKVRSVTVPEGSRREAAYRRLRRWLGARGTRET